jgi:hypothetical protein
MARGIVRNIQLGLPLELLLEMFQERVVEVLSAQVGVTRSSLDSEDAASDIEKGDIKSSSSQIEDENVAFCF